MLCAEALKWWVRLSNHLSLVFQPYLYDDIWWGTPLEVIRILDNVRRVGSLSRDGTGGSKKHEVAKLIQA